VIPPSACAAQGTRALTLQAVWALLTTVMLIVGMSFLWLVGSQAMRRMQVSRLHACLLGCYTQCSWVYATVCFWSLNEYDNLI